MVIILSLDYSDPVAEDVSLTAKNVHLSLVPHTVKRVRNDRNEQVQEDDICHYYCHEKPGPENVGERCIILQVVQGVLWLTNHRDCLDDYRTDKVALELIFKYRSKALIDRHR